MCLIHKWEYKIEKLKNEKKKYIKVKQLKTK